MGKFIDMTGKKFGKLTVVEVADRYPSGGIRWLCNCDCGSTTLVEGGHLRQGNVKSCGCIHFDKAGHLEGQRFGRLVVIAKAKSRNRQAQWECLCDCGKSVVVCGGSLRVGCTQSCGCYRDEVNSTHGMSHRVPEYDAWANMLRRCGNSNHPSYHNYGGRGIEVCDRWRSFENFYADMGPRPTPNHSLDRIDVNSNYEPNNCRWATFVEQQNNRQTNRRVTIDGESLTISQLSRITGISVGTLANRHKRGWSAEEIISGRQK